MEKIIENLYNIHITKENFPFGVPNKEQENREWELYNNLYEKLSGDERAMFLEYAELRAERQKEERQAVYMYGFKTAIRLIIESLKE